MGAAVATAYPVTHTAALGASAVETDLATPKRHLEDLVDEDIQ
jgi:hypothetical protein